MYAYSVTKCAFDIWELGHLEFWVDWLFVPVAALRAVGGYFAASAIIIAGQGTLVLLIAHDFRPSKRCHFVRNFALNSLKNHEHETWFERCQLWSRERRRRPKAPGRHFASGISESSREIEERGRRRSQG